MHPASNDLPDAAKPFGSHPERFLSPLAQAVAVCEMSVLHVRGAGTVCKMTMQHLHGLFTVCEMTMQHLLGPFTVCGGTMQHLHSPFTVCGGTMQHLHSVVAVCETTMQHLRGLSTVCEMIMQALHSLFGVCDSDHTPGGASGKPFSEALRVYKPVVFEPRCFFFKIAMGPHGGKDFRGGGGGY